MTAPRPVLLRVLACLLACALAACGAPPAKVIGPKPTKGFEVTPDILDSAYSPVERGVAPPADFGLYTTVLVRSANRNAIELLAELFASTGSITEAAIPHRNLNLVMVPVKNAVEARRLLAAARAQPKATAAALMQNHYDFGQAALLLASVCRPQRGDAVMKVCGSATPDGPILVTGLSALDPAVAAGQPLLVVNLGKAPAGAVPEIVAAYRRQVMRKQFDDRAEVATFRLAVLNGALNVATLLPAISKAYAGGP